MMPEDFVKFGLIPEFIGRVPVVVSLDALDEETLVRILKEPKNSLVKQYRKMFEMDGVTLSFDEDALREIARESLERKTGARGLRAIMEKSMMDVMFEAPSDNTIRECHITKEAVEGKEPPVLVHGEPAPVPRRARTRSSRQGHRRLREE